ncbi:unnamed protein product [Boreogadus saida]
MYLIEGRGLLLLGLFAGLQIAAECRSTPVCRPGFSEDVYHAVLPHIAEKGEPLFTAQVSRLILEVMDFPLCFLWMSHDQGVFYRSLKGSLTEEALLCHCNAAELSGVG